MKGEDRRGGREISAKSFVDYSPCAKSSPKQVEKSAYIKGVYPLPALLLPAIAFLPIVNLVSNIIEALDTGERWNISPVQCSGSFGRYERMTRDREIKYYTLFL